MSKNTNYLKIYCSLAAMYALGVCGGGLHGMQQGYLPSWVREGAAESFSYLKKQAHTMMSKNYTIPQVYVWGGVLAFAGLSCLYGRQCSSLRNTLCGPGTLTQQLPQEYQCNHRFSYEELTKLYPTIKGLIPQFELLGMCNKISDASSLSGIHAKSAAQLSERFSESEYVTLKRDDVIKHHGELAQLYNLLNEAVFPALRILSQIRLW